jgi:hypothetical protein
MRGGAGRAPAAPTGTRGRSSIPAAPARRRAQPFAAQRRTVLEFFAEHAVRNADRIVGLQRAHAQTNLDLLLGWCG